MARAPSRRLAPAAEPPPVGRLGRKREWPATAGSRTTSLPRHAAGWMRRQAGCRPPGNTGAMEGVTRTQTLPAGPGKWPRPAENQGPLPPRRAGPLAGRAHKCAPLPAGGSPPPGGAAWQKRPRCRMRLAVWPGARRPREYWTHAPADSFCRGRVNLEGVPEVRQSDALHERQVRHGKTWSVDAASQMIE